jgi:hypothetical protein
VWRFISFSYVGTKIFKYNSLGGYVAQWSNHQLSKIRFPKP